MMFWDITIRVKSFVKSQLNRFISAVTSLTVDSLSKITPTSPGSPFGSLSDKRALGSSTAKFFLTYLIILDIKLFHHLGVKTFDRAGDKFSGSGQGINDKRTCPD